MPKFSWDAFLGGIAETGLEGYKAGGQLAALKREADRREAVSAFDMGEKIPIIRGSVGGIGGLAGDQINQQAGIPSESQPTDQPMDYRMTGQVDPVGATPAVDTQAAQGDVTTPRAAGGMTAQAPPSPGAPASASASDDDVTNYLKNMNPAARKDMLAGIDANDKKQLADDVTKRVHDMSENLGKLRSIQLGSEAVQKFVDQSDVMRQRMGAAVDALYAQRSNTSDPAELQQIERKIVSINQQVGKLDDAVTAAKKHREGNVMAAQIAGREIRQITDTLKLMGAPEDLIENYKKVYMENGDIVNAERILTIRVGKGLGMKGPGKGGLPSRQGSAYTQPRPLR